MPLFAPFSTRFADLPCLKDLPAPPKWFESAPFFEIFSIMRLGHVLNCGKLWDEHKKNLSDANPFLITVRKTRDDSEQWKSKHVPFAKR